MCQIQLYGALLTVLGSARRSWAWPPSISRAQVANSFHQTNKPDKTSLGSDGHRTVLIYVENKTKFDLFLFTLFGETSVKGLIYTYLASYSFPNDSFIYILKLVKVFGRSNLCD